MMRSLWRWYEKRTTLGMAFIACLLLTGLGLVQITFGPDHGAGGARISIIVEHFGIDSKGIEESITIPLEEALQPLRGIKRIQSVSTFGRSRIDCTLEKEQGYPEAYAAVRAAVEGVYVTFPSSVQRPRILSGSSSRKPVLIAALPSGTGDAENFEEALEGLDGVGEIEVGGKAEEEVHILLDMEKATEYGLTPLELASRLASELQTTPAGEIQTEGYRIPVTGVGTGKNLKEIEEIPVLLSSGSPVPLSWIGAAVYGKKKPNSISRVNGEKRTVAYIQGNGNTSIVSLSRKIRAALNEMNNSGPFEAEILFDAGASAEKSLFQIFKALSAGMAAVAAVLVLFGGTVRQIAALAFFLPLSVAAAAAVFAAAGIGVDRYVLAGFALAAGMVTDINILISEHVKPAAPGTPAPLKDLFPPLISSTFTTVIVLIPFIINDDMAPGSKQIALSVTLTLGLNLLFALFFLPSFLIRPNYRRTISPRPGLPRKDRLKRKLLRGIYRIQKIIQKFRRCGIWAAAGAVILCSLAVYRMGTNFTAQHPENLLYAHIEFESGASPLSVDRKLTRLAVRFGEAAGIEQVETLAKRGAGTLTARFDPAVIGHGETADRLRELAASIPGCFAYIAENQNSRGQKIEIALTGPDHRTLRELVRTAASRLVAAPFIHEAVLHFKEDVPALLFEIDHSKAAAATVLPSTVARLLYWNVHPPVACKWTGPDGEKDLRIIAGYKHTRDDLSSITIPGTAGSGIRIGRFGGFSAIREPGTLYRENRQGVVYVTAHAGGRNIENIVHDLWKVLHTIRLPEGYGFQIDGRVFELQNRIRTLLGTALLVTVLVYMILAVQFESFLLPVLVTSSIPLTLAFPLTALWIGGKCITLPVLIGCIVLVGSSVNNAILITHRFAARASGFHFGAVLALRKRLRSLMLASCTTIVGALPLFFMTRGASQFLSELAFVIFFGTIGSVTISCTLFPAILAGAARRRRKNLSARGYSSTSQ